MNEPIDPDDDLFTWENFKSYCANNCFIDYDGYGEWSDGKVKLGIFVSPSEAFNMPDDAARSSHVVWYNR